MTAIRTPDQRVRVFVSSTMKELATARAAARRAIERLRLVPVLFELGARPYPPRELYLAYLRQSDIFIGIYGEQYGWIAPGQQVSGLEDEYLNAGDKPKLIYVQSPAPKRDARLSAMHRRHRWTTGRAWPAPSKRWQPSRRQPADPSRVRCCSAPLTASATRSEPRSGLQIATATTRLRRGYARGSGMRHTRRPLSAAAA